MMPVAWEHSLCVHQVFSLIQMKRVKHREVKKLTQCH
jgi:hypothetical protein